MFQGKNGDLLGPKQLKWLEDSLKDSNEVAKFIVSPLPFVMGKNPQDDYRANHIVWDKILNIAADNRITAILCADSHNYSRTDIKVKRGNNEITIPQLLVGILGGKPQEITSDERQLLKTSTKPLLPEFSDGITANYEASEVKAYYTPKPKPGGKAILGDAGMALPGKKEYRAYKNGKWMGDKVIKSAYGFVDMKVDLKEGKLFTSLYLSKVKKGNKPYFQDEAEYPLKAEKKVSCSI